MPQFPEQYLQQFLQYNNQAAGGYPMQMQWGGELGPEEWSVEWPAEWATAAA
jgi:hypothetical protein